MCDEAANDMRIHKSMICYKYTSLQNTQEILHGGFKDTITRNPLNCFNQTQCLQLTWIS